MALQPILVFCFLVKLVSSYTHSKPVALTLWPGKCTRGDTALNDCNWCRCNTDRQYACDARVCSEVDKFGHYVDTIRDIDVGMEGPTSAWRAEQTACEPLVQYTRPGLLCICNEDGNWPSPVCRDAFRVLHPVDISQQLAQPENQRCKSTSLYLINCNVCFCPSTGRIDPNLCTVRNCTKDDPVLWDTPAAKVQRTGEPTLDLYAECEVNVTYKFECRTCLCLKNNRLICDNCESSKSVSKSKVTNYCLYYKIGQQFNIDCNNCVCDKKGLMYCSVKKCLKLNTPLSDIVYNGELVTVDRPFDDLDCVPGTKYKKDCNTCTCNLLESGLKVYSCTLLKCNEDSLLDSLKTDCVPNTVYERSCQICYCSNESTIKKETCRLNAKCTGMKAQSEKRSQDLNSLHGYCEPSHTYQRDCNTGRCLPDGQVFLGTAKVCPSKDKEPITVDIVPVKQKQNSPCPKDHMYKVDCNYCFCLTNGNVLCSTADCNKKRGLN